MSSITVSNLETTGLSLFNDKESYLNEIKDAELAMINGGGTLAGFITASSGECVAFGYAAAKGAAAAGVAVYLWLTTTEVK